MATEMSRMDVVGQNGNDGLHYLEDVGDEQHHVDKRIEPIDQRPATAHYWSTGGNGHVPGWYKVAHDGEWWFWRTDRDCWLHAPCPADDVLNNLEALPPLDTATHVAGSYYFRLGQHGWECWKSGSTQWIGCMTPNPGSVDRVIHPGFKPNASEMPNSSNHIVETNEKVEPYRPTPGIECEARTPRDNQWPKWTPVVVRAYDGNEVWFRCLITNESFSGPIDRIEFRPKPELAPLSKGGELNQASWDDFVSRLRHDCVGEGVHRHYTAEAVFIVQKRDITYGIDLDYTDNIAIIVEDSAYHSIQEYWDALDDPERAALNVASQEEEECDFLEMNQRYQLDLLSELDNHTITGWDECWEYVNSHFTHDAAEAFIQRKKHDYPKGLRVYTDAQIYCWEYNTIKEAILSGKLKFVDADIQSNG
jgi:hypothetical protein